MGTSMKKNMSIVLQVPGTYRYLAATILLGTISGGLIITQSYFLSRIINSVFLEAQALYQVWHFMLILLVLILARALLTWLNSMLANRLAGRVKLSLRERIARHLFALGPAYVRGERSGELITTTIEGVEALDPYVSQYLPQVFLSIIVPAIILVTVFSHRCAFRHHPADYGTTFALSDGTRWHDGGRGNQETLADATLDECSLSRCLARSHHPQTLWSQHDRGRTGSHRERAVSPQHDEHAAHRFFLVLRAGRGGDDQYRYHRR